MLVLTLILVWAGAAGAVQVPIMVRDNLFSPERKPVSSDEAKPAPTDKRKAKSMEKAFQLDGVFYYGDLRTALIRVNQKSAKTDKEKNPSPYVRVREKDLIGDYQVVRIEPKAVTLEGNGETLTIPLFQQGKVSPPATPLPPAPSAAAAGQAAAGRPGAGKEAAGQAPAQPPGTPEQGGQTGAPPPASAQPEPAPVAQPEPAPPAAPRSWRAQGDRAPRSSGTDQDNDSTTDTLNELRQAIETLQQGANQ